MPESKTVSLTIKIITMVSVILVFFLTFSFLNHLGNKEMIKVDKLVAKRIAGSAANAIEHGYITESVIDQELDVPDEVLNEKPDSSDIGGILAYSNLLPVGKIKNSSPKGPKRYIYSKPFS